MGLLGTIKMYAQRSRQHEQPTDLYTHEVDLLEGGSLDLGSLRGNPTLIVNTASQCGFTPQFEGLQELYERYSDRGLQVLGCPSADFMDQEHDDADETADVCRRNYGVTFPMAGKMSVRSEPHPLWDDLARQPGSKPPVWNFSKYLVDGEGHLLARWPTKVKPDDPALVGAIEQALERPR